MEGMKGRAAFRWQCGGQTGGARPEAVVVIQARPDGDDGRGEEEMTVQG